MSRAFVKESDDAIGGSPVDRFYQAVLGLSDPARALVAKRQQEAWSEHPEEVEQARKAAQEALGAESYREVFDSATRQASAPSTSPLGWAIGDAAVAVAARRRLSPGYVITLVSPLSVALPWLKSLGDEVSVRPLR